MEPLIALNLHAVKFVLVISFKDTSLSKRNVLVFVTKGFHCSMSPKGEYCVICGTQLTCCMLPLATQCYMTLLPSVLKAYHTIEPFVLPRQQLWLTVTLIIFKALVARQQDNTVSPATSNALQEQ